MAEFQITAEKREVTGKKVGRLRRTGKVPGIVYGPQIDPISLTFEYRELELALMRAGGTNVVEIEVDGNSYPTIARDVQRDVLKGTILHVDFFAPDMNKKIRAEVPVNLVGESPMVTSRKAILITGPNSVTVEMLPSRLMNKIDVDLSLLVEMGDTIYVTDLPLDEDINVINDPDEMIAKIVQPSAARAEEALEALEAAAAEGEGEDEGEATEESEEE